TIRPDSPDLWLAVPGGLLFRLALAVADEVDPAPVGAPTDEMVASAIAGQATGRPRLRGNNPQIGLAIVAGLPPAPFRISHPAAVRRHGDFHDIRLGEVILHGDVMIAYRCLGTL